MTRFLSSVVGIAGLVIGVFPTIVQGQESSGYALFAANHTATTDYQETRITLDLHDVAAHDAIQTIAAKAGLTVSWSREELPLDERVTVMAHNVTVSDALTRVLRGTGGVAKISEDNHAIVIVPARNVAPQVQQTSGVITGRVTDSTTGEGLSGAAVSVQGMKRGVLTSKNGEFVLRDVALGKQWLTVKLFGFKATSRAVTVTDSTHAVVHVVLAPATTMLSGVVTTATGEQSKLSVGSDITTINVDSVMQTAPVSSVTDLLENRVPGLTTLHTSGTPGDPSRLLLRGAASIYGNNNPIVVVDGVRIYDPQDLGSVRNQFGFIGFNDNLENLPRPSPLDQIDPNTIESIEVLKGPSASALYGSDAANGVIVIKTKKGRPGRTHWTVSAEQGISYIPGGYPSLTYVFGHRLDSYSENQCTAGMLSASIPCLVDSVRTFQALNDPRFSPLTSGPLSRASATVSGGVQGLTYSFTGSAQNTHGMTKLPSAAAQQYTEAVGTLPPSWMRHPDDYLGWSSSGTVQANLGPQTTLTMSNILSSTAQHRTDLGLNAVGQLTDVYVDTTDLANSPAYSSFATQITQATLVSTSNAVLHWPVRSWLPLNVTGGYNRTQETDKIYLPSGLPSVILPLGSDTTGSYDLAMNQVAVATLNINTTVPLSVWQGRQLTLALGTNFVSQSAAAQNFSTTQVPVGVTDPTAFLQTATTVNQTTQSTATYGWFFEPQLAFRSRLWITPGIRFDGGTSSGNSAGLVSFPKTQIAYLAVDHTGETGGSPWSRPLSLLRLRGAFGIAGVQPTPGQSLRLFSTPNTVSLDGGGVATTGMLLTTLGNTLLQPERSRELDMGFDAQFFQDQIELTATYYNKLRIDAIESVPVAPSVLGSEQIYQNVGNIRNSGVELTSTVRVLDRSAVTWSLNGSLSTNVNRVVSTASGTVNTNLGCETSTLDGYVIFGIVEQSCIRAGYPLDAKFAPVIVGYGDLNHDGVIERNEVFLGDSAAYVGSPDPRYEATIGTTFALGHGRLSISASGDYQDGLTVFSNFANTVVASESNQLGANTATLIEGVLSGQSVAATNYFTVVNAFRLDAVSMNLTLPIAIARFFHAQQATIALQGSNIGLWTNFQGKDPLSTGAISNLDAVEGSGLSLPRTWQFTMRITQ